LSWKSVTVIVPWNMLFAAWSVVTVLNSGPAPRNCSGRVKVSRSGWPPSEIM
jgi:hypothetical protein